MAMVGTRSNVLTTVQVFSKTLLYSNNCHKLHHVQQACMLSSSVQNVTSSNKDELYRLVTLEVKGHDKAVLDSYEKFTSMAAKELDVHIAKIYEPPKIIARLSLMKSVFVHKKHFHQYEMRTIFKVFELKNLTGSTTKTFLEYIQRNLPEGLAMKVTKHQIEKFPEHIKPPSTIAPNTKISTSDQENGKKSAEAVSYSQGENKTSDAAISKTHDSRTSLSESKNDKKKASKTPSEDKS